MSLDTNHSSMSFSEVLREEQAQVEASRQARRQSVDQQLVGLALSGGGVRSATFSLGVLQGLARFGLLRRLDYLSSTGGGSLIAGWLLKWIQARGYSEVEHRLPSKDSSSIEAAEIQALRRSMTFPKGREVSTASIAVLSRLRNVILNLLALAALLGAALLLTRLTVEQVSMLWFDLTPFVASAAISAILLAALSLLTSGPKSPPTQLRTLLTALVLGVFCIVILSAAIGEMGSSAWAWAIIGGLAVACFSLILGRPSPLTPKVLLAQLVAAVAAGLLASTLLLLIRWGLLLDAHQEALLYWSGFSVLHQFYTPITVALSLIALSLVISLLLYASIVRHWLSRERREIFWRLCRTLASLAMIWLLAVLTWTLPFPIGWRVSIAFSVLLILTAAGFLKVAGVRGRSTVARFFLDLLERLAPYTFAAGITAIVATMLRPLLALTGHGVNELAAIAFLSLIAIALLWLIRARRFNLYSLHKSLIVRNYLTPSGQTQVGIGDMDLSSLANPPLATYPYPLFGAALEVAEVTQDSFVQPRTVPFFFSPLFSGFELSRRRSASDLADGYRPTKKLGGGISLATAMAISQPSRDKSLRPASAAVAMLWTIFDLRDGRFLGNPLRNDTWNKQGPLIEPIYALREGLGDLPSEAPYVRPYPGQDFDNLGIYQLVKRRCRFIIACDATRDPDFSFEDLGATILRCRTELNVEIQMDLGPLGRTPSSSGAHCQIAHIKYGRGEDGLMVYIKPSLTGDEPTGLVQYARVHQEFPATDVATGRFGERDFESYRALGEHIIESLLAELRINSDTPTNEVFHLIRAQLQPDFKEPEAKPAPTAAESTPSVPQELIDAIATGECVLCAGSGLAAQAKLPTWAGFLDGLLRSARDNGVIDASTASGLAATLAAGELEAVADELTHQVPRDHILEYVRSATTAEPSAAHKILAQMKFFGALNTNMDDVLGAAFGSRILVPSQSDRLVSTLQSKRFFVANLFGSISEPSSLLFTMKEFRQLLLANSQFKQFLGSLFLRYTIVFVGSSIDAIRDFLEALELPQGPERRHYALVPNVAQIDPVKLRFLERSYNVGVVDFQPQFNFTGLPAFLSQLQSAVNESAPQTKAAGALTLKSVTLENIGPFHSLHVDFTPTWNLLLGDNGVGKTVVLKAIAAALCGERAEPQAVTRLLRSGANKGSIRLKDENREYTVELERRIDGSVHIFSASLSPIIYERWLALGFPALRSIPLTRPKGPTKPRPEAPSAEDLLPILRGEPDDRISDIKQWLVNLDYAAKSEPSPSRSRILFNDFFKVLQRLTPDLRLEPGQINNKTMEITVVTDAGIVPMEAISQGTGSVMCWIGTLLERLSETGNQRNAEHNTALILIDELDAHMHPKWQQMFVEGFRKEFKSVQIIATTHSPLLVGSLKPEEIWLVHRAPLKSEIYGVVHIKEGSQEGLREIVVVGPEDDAEEGHAPSPREERHYLVSTTEELLVRNDEIVEEGEPLTKGNIRVEAERIQAKEPGWRADQILTSPLFELETTRDPETAQMLREYTHLTALEDPSESNQRRLVEIARHLQIRLATPQETLEARKAYDLIEDFAKDRLNDIPLDQRRKVLDEVRVQLQESITGSRRPQ